MEQDAAQVRACMRVGWSDEWVVGWLVGWMDGWLDRSIDCPKRNPSPRAKTQNTPTHPTPTDTTYQSQPSTHNTTQQGWRFGGAGLPLALRHHAAGLDGLWRLDPRGRGHVAVRCLRERERVLVFFGGGESCVWVWGAVCVDVFSLWVGKGKGCVCLFV
jgi:hypothetical protein